MRCKLYAILLPAYTILGMEEEAAKAGWRYADYASSRQGGAVACTCCGYTLWLYG